MDDGADDRPAREVQVAQGTADNLGRVGWNELNGVDIHAPQTRGTAMNPVDHPHGGGEGRTSGGRHPTTPWGKPTKGYRTRHNKRTDKMIVRRRK